MNHITRLWCIIKVWSIILLYFCAMWPKGQIWRTLYKWYNALQTFWPTFHIKIPNAVLILNINMTLTLTLPIMLEITADFNFEFHYRQSIWRFRNYETSPPLFFLSNLAILTLSHSLRWVIHLPHVRTRMQCGHVFIMLVHPQLPQQQDLCQHLWVLAWIARYLRVLHPVLFRASRPICQWRTPRV